MGTYHVRAGSGDCWNGIKGEGFYVYTATGAVGGHLGCFIDSDGHASVRWTRNDVLIYSGATGRGRSLWRVVNWVSTSSGPYEYSG